MQKQIRVCDLCGKEIPDSQGDSGMILAHHKYQAWPDKDGTEKDVCHFCCIVLSKARKYGLVSFDDALLFSRGGFSPIISAEDGETRWTYPSYLGAYGGTIME